MVKLGRQALACSLKMLEISTKKRGAETQEIESAPQSLWGINLKNEIEASP